MRQQSTLQPEYESYLLRLWHDKTAHTHSCRIMLQHVVTQQQHFFTDLPTLFAFLGNLLDSEEPAGEQAPQ